MICSLRLGFNTPAFIRLSQSGRYFTDGSNIWSTLSGEKIITINKSINNDALCVGFSSDEKFAFVVPDFMGMMNAAFLLDLESEGRCFRTVGGYGGSFHTIASVKLTINSNQALTTDIFGMTLLWDLGKGEVLHILNPSWGVPTKPLAISQNGRFAVVDVKPDDAKPEIQICELSTGNTLKQLQCKSRAFVFTPDNKHLLSPDAIWCVDNWEIIRCFDGHEDYRDNGPLCLSENGYLVLSVCKNNSISMWSLLSGKEIQRFQNGKAVESLAFSLESGYVITCGGEEGVFLWEPERRSLPTELENSKGTKRALFLPGSDFIIGCNDTEIILWDRISAMQINNIKMPDFLISVDVSQDGKLLYLTTSSMISIWEIKHQ